MSAELGEHLKVLTNFPHILNSGGYLFVAVTIATKARPVFQTLRLTIIY